MNKNIKKVYDAVRQKVHEKYGGMFTRIHNKKVKLNGNFKSTSMLHGMITTTVYSDETEVVTIVESFHSDIYEYEIHDEDLFLALVLSL